MFLPPSLLVKANETMDIPENLNLNNGTNNIPFIEQFKYLGALITPELIEDAEIKAQINKAKAQMDLLKQFFNCRDVDRRVTQGSQCCWFTQHPPLGMQILEYHREEPTTTLILSLFLFGYLYSQNHRNKMESSPRAMNYKQRSLNAVQETSRYVKKVFRSKNKAIPTKLLGASMDPLPQKIGCSQNSCKSNFLEAVQSNTPEVNKNSGWL